MHASLRRFFVAFCAALLLPLVAIGHEDPMPSRPLNLEEIARMRSVVVPSDVPVRTEVPPWSTGE